jgi:hypothetical protein
MPWAHAYDLYAFYLTGCGTGVAKPQATLNGTVADFARLNYNLWTISSRVTGESVCSLSDRQ